MGRIVYFQKSEIEEALQGLRRVYFAGNLKRKEKLDVIKTEDIEIGISSYSAFAEPTHFHYRCSEFQYMLSGYTEYMDVESKQVYRFRKGDFFMIAPNTKYAQKVKRGTSILFIKIPSFNDKTLVDEEPFVLEFLSKRIESLRKDYYHDPLAPKANSFRPAVSCALWKNGRLLLLKRKDNQKWTLPGGTIEYGESSLDALRREVKEETNLTIVSPTLFKIYDDPGVIVEYLDGEVRREFTIVYLAEHPDGEIILDEESTQYRYFSIKELPSLEFAPSQRIRILDLIERYENHDND